MKKIIFLNTEELLNRTLNLDYKFIHSMIVKNFLKK